MSYGSSMLGKWEISVQLSHIVCAGNLYAFIKVYNVKRSDNQHVGVASKINYKLEN